MTDARIDAASDPSDPTRKTVPYIRKHPWMTSFIAVCTLAGVAAALCLPLGESLSMPRRIIGGAVVGFYFSLFPLGFRLFE